jgi:HD-GYP domain-containing protein (c-di-GMP phosphodiesterase class II)
VEHFSIKDIKAGSWFSEAVYLDSKFILTAPESSFESSLVRALLEWDFREVLSDGEIKDSYEKEEPIENESQETTKPSTGAVQAGDNEKAKRASDYYNELIKYVEQLFTRFVTKNDINIQEVSEYVRNLCEAVKEDRRFLLRVQDPENAKENYLARHSVKSTIIAIVLGVSLKLPNHRLIELGTAALLHEIGMVKLPPQLYMTNKPLSPPERKAILTHPILSYNILKNLSFPLAICVAALEHHERENGEGYPRKLSGDKISLYAKIISVACSYEALTAVRPYKSAKDGYAGMIDLLKNVGKQYDDQIVRALVYSLSIYPIGLYVLLSSGQQAQVVDVNPENPRFPIVQLIKELGPDGRKVQLETSSNSVYIVRPLRKEEF